MFKVMIVDDEIYVVALIRKLVDWERFQMNVEATANDGVTALELVREIKPDLVIVDIRMPGYDGIAFMDKVREFNSSVKFIVISGHKQFDYAKGAMRNNVEDYLLKPINKEELENVIGHVHEKLLASQETESKLKEMEEELDSSKKRIRRLMVQSVMRQEYDGLDADTEQINAQYLTSFEPGNYRMLALLLDVPAAKEVSADNGLMLREARRKLHEELTALCKDVLDSPQENGTVFLINYEPEAEEAITAVLQEQMKAYNAKVKKFENLFFRLCVGVAGKSLAVAAQLRDSLLKCMLARTAMPEGKIIFQNDIRESAAFLEAVLEYRGERFKQALSELNAGEVSRCIREMYSKAFYGIEEDTLLYYKLYAALADQTFAYFSNVGICSETENEFRERSRQIFLEAPGAGEYPRILYREIERMIQGNQLSGQSQEAPAIRIVKRYIRDHYQEDISLSMLAELANISPVYLSRLFKKEEGINFLDYLNQYRIEEAKKLLRDIRFNVIEVAELSGFRNTKYFSRIFKRAVGITPSEYRKRHLGKEELL